MSVTAIQNEIPSLSPEEKVKLIDLLWDSLSDPELTAREAAWAAESERRIDAFDAGKLEARDVEEVRADFKNNLAEVKARFLSTAELELKEGMEFTKRQGRTRGGIPG